MNVPATLSEIAQVIYGRYSSWVFRFRDVNNPNFDYLTIDPQSWQFDRHGVPGRVHVTQLGGFFSSYRLPARVPDYVLLSTSEELNVLRYMNDSEIIKVLKESYRKAPDLSHIP